jgi:ATP-binding cassette subfamily F protein 3
MIDEPKIVSLDWLASKKVNASQVDRSKLEKAEYKLRMKAISRNKKAMADQASEIAAAVQKQLELMSTSATKKTPVEIVDELILEQNSSAAVSRQHDIIVEGFDISLAGRRILTNASMTLAFGRRYGLIGRNGIGKSTLLRHIASYQLSIPKSLSILHVEQEVVGDDTLALTSVLQADVKREALLSEERRLTALLHTDLSPENSKMASERLQTVYRLLQDMDSDDAEARYCFWVKMAV